MSVLVPGDVQPEFPVALITSPSNQQASVGGTATFTVVVDGGGTVTYQWQTTNHRLSRLSGFNPLPGAEGDGFWTLVGATGPSYTTPILQLVDTGTQFQCLVKNSNTVPQSIGNLTLFQTHGVSIPFTTPQQLFSVLMTQPAILLVFPKTSFVVSDNFQRANENPLSKGGVWTTVTGESSFQVVSNLCEPATPSAHIAMYYSGVSWPNDQFSEMILQFVNGGSSNIGPTVRASSSSDTYYWVTSTGTLLVLYAKVNGTPTLLNFSSTSTTTGDVIRLEVVGANLTVKKNGTVVFTAIDSTISSGSAGIAATSGSVLSDAQISLWDGGTL